MVVVRRLRLLLVAVLLAGCAGLPSTPSPSASLSPNVDAHDLGALANFGPFSAEPTIAARAHHLVVANIEYLALEGPLGQRRFWLALHVSTDGGLTWQDQLLPRSVLAPFDPAGQAVAVGDPALSYAPDGSLWLSGIAAFGFGNLTGAQSAVALTGPVVFAARSSDDGVTWQAAEAWWPAPGTLAGATGSSLPAGAFFDKEGLAAGPDGRIHVCWTAFIEAQTTLLCATRTQTWAPPLAVATALPGRILTAASLAAGEGMFWVAAQDTLLAGADLGGPDRERVWQEGTPFTELTSPGPAVGNQYGTLVAAGKGALWYLGVQPDGAAYGALSTDRAASWSRPAALGGSGKGPQLQPAGWVGPDSRLRAAFYDGGWPQGEHATVAVGVPGAWDLMQPIANVTAPGKYRRDYIGVAGDGATAWAVWVQGSQESATHIEVARIDG